jgi:hypothetical protein
MLRFVTSLFALLASVAVLTPGSVSACSCTNNLTLQEEVGYATSVFSGRVLSVQSAGDGYNIIATLEPIARWKGPVGASVAVVTPDNHGTCGFEFAVGVEYLVIASQTLFEGNMMPFTHLCSRTGLLENNPFVPQLGPPLLPTDAAPMTWGAIKTIYR